MSEIELHNETAAVTVRPEAGGRIAQIEVRGRPLLLDDQGDGPLSWGCYPMVPWAGRLRDGRFRFEDDEHQLPLTLAPHAIHGTGWQQQWSVEDQGLDYVDLRCRLAWPLGGIAQQHLQLTDDALVCFLAVMADARAMPAVIGWHPWFRKPDRAELTFARMYRRDASLVATAELVPVPAGPWDDCFIEPRRSPVLHYPDALAVTVDSDCDHWVVFDQFDDVTCIEPQSGPPDAFNLGMATHLEPGELLQRRMSIGWR